MLIYKNARIVTHSQEIHGFIEIDDTGKLIKIQSGETNKPGIDCQNRIILPGFIDAHTHGGYGMSFDDFEIDDHFLTQYQKYLTNLSAEGVVGFVPTNVSLTLTHLDKILDNVHKYLSEQHNKFAQGPQMVAWFFEGPFISKAKKGAHDEKVLIPLNEDFLNKALKLINLPIVCAIAPEVANNLEIMKKYSDQIIFSLGHSNADYQQAVAAFNAGAKRVIHLYNAMSGFHHHDMGIVNAVFNHEYHKDVNIELISDGVHVTNEVIKTTYNLIDANNLSIISDCLSAKGLPNGVYHLGSLAIEKRGNWFYLENTNTLAGGGLPYNELVRHFYKTTKCQWTEIVKFSSYNTARNLGLAANYGDLKLDALANLVIIDEDFKVYTTIANGKVFNYVK